ncbi:FAD-binding domain-containing protein [Clathrospora elynae]|uniref:FAD-binding domain-containing protein n=1 Tax=Clathrospora elynae TaxID=706981 RepID=A0A6A5S978_9PLEO|nr:FAD-binding domain-containing protein [Clathrospora elynae]
MSDWVASGTFTAEDPRPCTRHSMRHLAQSERTYSNPGGAQRGHATLLSLTSSLVLVIHPKTMPGDLLYLGKITRRVFDLLLGGALEKIVPIGSPCYKKSYYNDNGTLMNPLYYGMTCPIPASGNYANGTCTQGGYAEFAVKVSNIAQIQLAVNLARTLNLRLVVRNTGHDYNGRSVGKGALSIWTHGLKEIKYVKNYKSPTYNGPVFKVGSGVQSFELYQAAGKYGVSTVAGICPTVGVFGGYSTGGGHSPLMQLFGVDADQVIALEVVLASGRFVTATPSVNSDLYLAMLGGGGGTFRIITSAVVKVHRKVPVTVSTWTLMTSEISMAPFFATDKTVAEYEVLMKPLFDKCASFGIQLTANTTHYDSFYPACQATFGPSNYNVGGAGAIPGNRLVPSDNWASSEMRGKTFAAVQNTIENALLVLIYHQRPAEQEKEGINSVNPAFRNEESMIVAINAVSDLTAAGWKAGSEQLTIKVLGPLREVTPTGGSYGKEADIAETDWQKAFWGANYPRLQQIKQKYDPGMLFYVHHGVGTEGWAIIENGNVGVQSTDGPLCRV